MQYTTTFLLCTWILIEKHVRNSKPVIKCSQLTKAFTCVFFNLWEVSIYVCILPFLINISFYDCSKFISNNHKNTVVPFKCLICEKPKFFGDQNNAPIRKKTQGNDDYRRNSTHSHVLRCVGRSFVRRSDVALNGCVFEKRRFLTQNQGFSWD